MEFNFIFPKFKLLSGAERLILKLAEYVVKAGHSVSLICHKFHQSCHSQLYPGIKLVETKKRMEYFSSHYFNAPFDYFYSIPLKNYLNQSADVFCFFGTSLPLLWYMKAIKKLQKPCLYFCYEPPRFIYQDREKIISRMGVAGALANPFFSLYKLIDRRLIRRADAILVSSRFDQQQVEEAYRKDSHIISVGVDVVNNAKAEELRQLGETYGIDDSHKIILTVNFLHPRKRIDLLIRAMSLIQERVPRAKALVVGDGPERERLESLCKELKVEEGVIFCGFVPEDKLPLYYKLADLYLHTAKEETLGLSVMEASSYGKPVVTVDEGGPRETILQGKSGFRVEASPQALAEKAVLLLQRADLANQMGLRGKKHIAEQYSWQKGADELIKLSQKIITNYRR